MNKPATRATPHAWNPPQVQLRRTDEEYKQSVTRLAIIGLVGCWIVFIRSEVSAQAFAMLRLAVAFHVCFAVINMALVARYPGFFRGRRFLGIFVDQWTAAACMCIGGEPLAVFLFVVPWVSVGNGIRYGRGSLFIATFIGSAGLVVVILTTRPWTEHPHLAWGVVATTVLVPMYISVLLARLESAHAALARDAKSLEHEASHDGLTGLVNRAAFNRQLESRLCEAGAKGEAVGLIFVDLDNFKSVNDSLGHAEGDDLLKAVAQEFAATIRCDDTLARLGGDEFAVLLHRPSGDAMKRVSEALVRGIDRIAGERCDVVRVGASIGSAISKPGEDATSFLKRADHAMYAAKRASKHNAAVKLQCRAPA